MVTCVMIIRNNGRYEIGYLGLVGVFCFFLTRGSTCERTDESGTPSGAASWREPVCWRSKRGAIVNLRDVGAVSWLKSVSHFVCLAYTLGSTHGYFCSLLLVGFVIT